MGVSGPFILSGRCTRAGVMMRISFRVFANVRFQGYPLGTKRYQRDPTLVSMRESY